MARTCPWRFKTITVNVQNLTGVGVYRKKKKGPTYPLGELKFQTI